MRRWFAIAFVITLAASASAQTRMRKPPPPPPPPAAPEKVAPDMVCPTPLGVGLKTKRAFCDVMTGRDPAEGILIKIPPHNGPVELTFDLHNRHTYSEEQVKANRAYASYTPRVAVC